MPRQYKKRRVCCEPEYLVFSPEDGREGITELSMTVDEFESIRQIDLEGLSQEECAARMGIARTTAQAVYNSARKKLAETLVYGRRLRIEGGNYVLCTGENPRCGVCGMQPAQGAIQILNAKDDTIMRIAATYENGMIFQHFGRTPSFKVYDVEDGKIVSAQVIDNGGQGHGALAGVLGVNKVDVLVCGGIGGGAQMALMTAGIQLCSGASGDADQAVAAYLAGTLESAGVTCGHHGEGHTCGHHSEGHGCGSHGCGHHG